MQKLTSRERILRAIRHQEIDRIPMVDSAWRGTIERWRREGLPAGTNWEDYFGYDKVVRIFPDTSPRFEKKVLEETDRYQIVTTSWGMTQKKFFELDSTPEPLGSYYSSSDKWEECKARILTDYEDRIPWDHIKKNYAYWKENGYLLQLGFFFGFDITHSHLVGTENVLIGMYEEPEWIEDIFDTCLGVALRLSEKLLDAGYEFDGIFWYDDMGYKGSTFFSPSLYRSLLKPYHKRAVDWAHARGMIAELHSCGFIEPLMDDLIDIGVDMLNPLEVKAGMDPFKMKEKYGDKIAFRGGINAQLWDKPDEVLDEISRLIPVLKEGGGYVFASDHSIPNCVTFDTMKKIVALVNELGKYN